MTSPLTASAHVLILTEGSTHFYGKCKCGKWTPARAFHSRTAARKAHMKHFEEVTGGKAA